jgi:aminoglycoside phosphotransferase (APT) family kinase protein
MPFSVIGYPWIRGTPLHCVAHQAEREKFFPQLGEFLSQLHSIPLEELPKEVPWFRWTGEEEAGQANGWQEGLRRFCTRIQNQVLPLLSDSTRRKVTREIHDFLSRRERFDFHPVLIHGDLALPRGQEPDWKIQSENCTRQSHAQK